MDSAPILAKLVAERHPALAFNIVELGAVPVAGHPEPFHKLLQFFPASRISAVELEPAVCEQLNLAARPGMRYYPQAIGRSEEQKTLYVTADPMCTSLYEPDERYLDRYMNLEGMRLRRKTSVRTVSLNAFVADNGIGPIDFIKMDIQGAELDVLQGASHVLSAVLALVLELEFVPLYKDQPLLGDVDAYLREQDFSMHKIISVYGRMMKPIVAHGDLKSPTQIMWCDGLYTVDLLDLRGLSEQQLLKLAVILDLYESCDAAYYVVRRYDEVCGTALGSAYLEPMEAAGWRVGEA